MPTLNELFVAQHVRCDVPLVNQASLDNHVRHGESKRRVTPSPRLDHLIGKARGLSAHRVDEHDPGTVRPRLFEQRQHVYAGHRGILAPQDAESGVGYIEGVVTGIPTVMSHKGGNSGR